MYKGSGLNMGLIFPTAAQELEWGNACKALQEIISNLEFYIQPNCQPSNRIQWRYLQICKVSIFSLMFLPAGNYGVCAVKTWGENMKDKGRKWESVREPLERRKRGPRGSGFAAWLEQVGSRQDFSGETGPQRHWALGWEHGIEIVRTQKTKGLKTKQKNKTITDSRGTTHTGKEQSQC